MTTRITSVVKLALALTAMTAMVMPAQETAPNRSGSQGRPEGPCDIYAAAGDPCVAAHSTTRALYAAYNGPLYQILRRSDGKTRDIGVVKASGADKGGYADAAAQDAFCASTYCWISKLYDQSPKHNDLTQAPRGGFSGPALGGFNNLPIADAAPITIMGHKAYGLFIAPGMGLRQNDAKGTAVDDQAEGQYWVINGLHHNAGCCFDYGNAEIDSRDDNNGTMETTYYGDSTGWYHGNPPGPWVMTDQENNLVGCVNSDGSKLCVNLPSISWRFVTAMAKGEPHHWTSMGGDAQRGSLSVMFDGPRIDSSYDPMRKQGAILLGNGGDNSNSSQGTYYEGAMTAAGTFPKDATDQLVQANVVAAGYGVQRLSLAPASATATPPGLQTFAPGSTQSTTLTFTNTSAEPVAGIDLSLALPGKGWRSVAAGTTHGSATIAGPVAPGASVNATFNVTAGPAALNGDLVAKASWKGAAGGEMRSETAVEKVRNDSPIKINEFRVGTSSPENVTNSFIELYNAGSTDVDLSNWSLTQHPTQQATFSTVTIPSGKKLRAGGFYLLGLANSGLAIPASAGDTTLYVRSTSGISTGHTLNLGAGSEAETHKVARAGTAAASSTTLWQPVPEGPVITLPVGSTRVPVTSVAGFTVGEKIALGYGASYPTTTGSVERYEVATVTAVGKPGTQAFLGDDAAAGATNLKVTSVADISVGDKIRLDIDSVGHGIETVTVAKVGTAANRALLVRNAPAGASNIKVRNIRGFAVGDKLVIGTPVNHKTYTLTEVGTQGPAGTGLTFQPAFAEAHSVGEDIINPGTGLDLAAPLRFNHAANLPFGDQGTGISFQPATVHVHSSNEPVQPLGTGITLDGPLTRAHLIDAMVQDASVTTAGYQGTPAPDQWFGGPALSANAGNMVLRDAAGLVVDSMNYGGLVEPWAAEGYQATSGPAESGCHVAAPGLASEAGASAGRFPDGVDTDSNCTDFVSEPATTLSAASSAGAGNVKFASTEGFSAGQPVRIGSGTELETAVIATVGTAGATTLGTATQAGASLVPVANARGFRVDQAITVGEGSGLEKATVVSVNRFGNTLGLAAPLTVAHAVGAQVSGTGISLTAPLKNTYASGAQVAGSASTPGAPNRYHRKAQ